MKNHIKQYGGILLLSLACTCVVLWPYLSRDFLAIEHDTFFHLSRIEGMASSMRHGEYLPAIYPGKNNGFGYASPLFYCDVMLIPAAMLYTVGLSLAAAYKVTVFAMTLLSLVTTGIFVKKVTGRTAPALIALTASAFANYRITNIYVRGALGEICAMAFFPVLLLGIHELLYVRPKTNRWILTAGLAGLVFSHNLSFLFGAILTAVFFLIRVSRLDQEDMKHFFTEIGIAFLLTAFFTLPMIEQLMSQQFYLSSGGTVLSEYTMQPWQYIVNTTVFGYGNNTYDPSQVMTVNPGWFLTIAPAALFLYFRKDDTAPFLRHCVIIGYVLLLLPCSLIPWDHLSFASVIQFPWRLVMAAMPFLALCAGEGICRMVKDSRAVTGVLIVLLTAEGILHIQPALNRTFGITSDTTYEQMTDGTVIDPYYSAFYVRVELAGADYLPVGSPDFRTREPVILTENGPLDTELKRYGTSTLFTLDQTYDSVELPLTWYKGYTMTWKDDLGNFRTVPCPPSPQRLVSMRTAEKGSYICIYQGTPVQMFSRHCSMLTLVFLIFGKHMNFRRIFSAR